MCVAYFDSILPCVLHIFTVIPPCVLHICTVFFHVCCILLQYSSICVVYFAGFFHVFASSHDAVFSPYSIETEFPTVCVTMWLTLTIIIITSSFPPKSVKTKRAAN